MRFNSPTISCTAFFIFQNIICWFILLLFFTEGMKYKSSNMIWRSQSIWALHLETFLIWTFPNRPGPYKLGEKIKKLKYIPHITQNSFRRFLSFSEFSLNALQISSLLHLNQSCFHMFWELLKIHYNGSLPDLVVECS